MNPVITFEERQVNPPWVGWLAVFFGVGLLAFLLYNVGGMWEASGGELTDRIKDLLGGAAGATIALTVVVWMIFSIQLKITIDQEGLTYFCFPVSYTEKRIEREDLAAFEIRKMSFREYIESGGSTSFFWLGHRNKEICVLNCWTVADMTLKNGRKVILGTMDPEGIERALKKLLS